MKPTKPCPFCGLSMDHPLSHQLRQTEEKEWVVMCSTCGAAGPMKTGKAASIRAWDERSDADKAGAA